MNPRSLEPSVGRSVPRKEARDKVTGRAQYVDDLSFPGMLHGATVRSPCARGRIRGIQFRQALATGLCFGVFVEFQADDDQVVEYARAVRRQFERFPVKDFRLAQVAPLL